MESSATVPPTKPSFPWKFWLWQLVPISMLLFAVPNKFMLTWEPYRTLQWHLGAANFNAFLEGVLGLAIFGFLSQATLLATWLVMGKRWPYFRLSAIAGICFLYWCPNDWLDWFSNDLVNFARLIQLLYVPIMPQLFLLGIAYALGIRLYQGLENENAIYHRRWRIRDLLLVLLVIPLVMADCAYWYGQLVKPISLPPGAKGLWRPIYLVVSILDGDLIAQALSKFIIAIYHIAFYSTLLMGVALLAGKRPWQFSTVVTIFTFLLVLSWIIPNSNAHDLNGVLVATAWQLAALCAHCLLLPPMGLTWGQAQAAQSHSLKNQPLVV